MLNTILTELGHRADFVGTGEAAVDAVAGGSYDAVLMDVTLPGIDGIEATRQNPRARRVRRRRCGSSACPDARMPSTRRPAVPAGMDAYLTKPLSPSALAAALAESVGRAD